jgi:hypothetical protein
VNPILVRLRGDDAGGDVDDEVDLGQNSFGAKQLKGIWERKRFKGVYAFEGQVFGYIEYREGRDMRDTESQNSICNRIEYREG